jgi:hypothetical protein
MLLSDALELALGLAFVFFLFSLTTTAVLEFLETLTRTRASKLLEGIKELLGDPAVATAGEEAVRAIYGHPLVQGLYRGDFETASKRSQLPSYVPTRNFALALMDQVIAGKISAAATNGRLPRESSSTFSDRLHLAAERIENPHLRQAMLQAARVGGDDVGRVRDHLEHWYDSAMDRVSGWYKRRSQTLLFWLGLLGALALNVNSLTLAEELAKNATLRRAIASEAERHDVAPADASVMVDKIDRLGLPIGWTPGAIASLELPLQLQSPQRTGWTLARGGFQIALGYLLTAFAISLGSPFWFDILNRLMVIRETVKPHEKSPEESSEDKQSDKTLTIITKPTDAATQTAPVPLAERPIDGEIYATPPQSGETPFEEW